MPGPRTSAWLFAAVFAAQVACDPGDEIELRVCGDLKTPEQIDALRVSVLDESLNELHAAVVELVPREPPVSVKDEEEAEEDSRDAGEPESPEVRSLPLTARLPGATGSGYVRVQGLLKGVEVARFDRRVYDLDALERAELVLKKNCYGRLSCPLGQTCVARLCEVAPTPDQSPGCD